MARIPPSVAEFLTSKRIAVAGVSRAGDQPANAIFRKLRDSGHQVVPVNPKATSVEGQHCYPSLATIPGTIDAVVIVTHPADAAGVVREAAALGITRLWFHRAFGAGSVSDEALAECSQRGIRPIVGGCPMMYCDPVDPAHRCFRWWLGMRRRLPA